MTTYRRRSSQVFCWYEKRRRSRVPIVVLNVHVEIFSRGNLVLWHSLLHPHPMTLELEWAEPECGEHSSTPQERFQLPLTRDSYVLVVIVPRGLLVLCHTCRPICVLSISLCTKSAVSIFHRYYDQNLIIWWVGYCT